MGKVARDFGGGTERARTLRMGTDRLGNEFVARVSVGECVQAFSLADGTTMFAWLRRDGATVEFSNDDGGWWNMSPASFEALVLSLGAVRFDPRRVN